MVFRIYALSLAFMLSTHLFSQGKEDFTKELFGIKLKYQKIEADTSYKIIVIDDAEKILGMAVDNGAELTGYFKNGRLVKVKEQVGLSNRVIQNKYYFENGQLFLVRSVDSNYKFNDSSQSFDYTKLIYKSGGNYYFKNDKMFDAILSDKERKATKDQYAKDLVRSIRKYSKLLNEEYSRNQ